MRETKFRGQCVEGARTMVYFGLGDIRGYSEDAENNLLVFPDFIDTNIAAIDLKTLGEYIGLHDKNGKEIYEGDVVRLFGEEFDKGDEPEFEVKWEKEGGYFLPDEMAHDYRPCLGDDNYELEIIGNIYENPELLK